MLAATNIKKSYGGKDVLNDISITLHRQKAALVGPNGVGKSTFLRILAGEETPDSGMVTTADLCRIGYLPQEIEITENDQTVADYLRAVVGIAEIEDKMRKVEKNLADSTTADLYEKLQQTYISMDGYRFDANMKKVLSSFGLAEMTDRPIDTLSGGQKTKVALTAVLLKGSDILLLDEPTNNLDFPSIIWLETFLHNTKAGCLIVSHDRHFIDRVVSKVYEIDWFEHQLFEYPGNYTNFLEFKRKMAAREQALYEAQQEEIQRLRESVRQKQIWGERARVQEVADHDKYTRGYRRNRSKKSTSRAKNLKKQIEKMILIEPLRQRPPLIIPLNEVQSDAKHAIELSEVYAGYDEFRIGPINLAVNYGERIGILGQNGVGKTTLLRVVTGDLEPFSGQVVVGPPLIVGNLTQGHEDLPRQKTPLEYFQEGTNLPREEIFNLLARFHFVPEEIQKRIEQLSPGERSRLILAMFAARSVSTLVLDEPTNHLDLDAVAALEEVLEHYSGTVIFVSHDRYFLEKVKPNHLFELKDGTISEIADYQNYLMSFVK